MLPMRFGKLCLLVVLVVIFAVETELGHAYDRPQPRETLVVSLAKGADADTPQQVHISLVGEDIMRISWITDDHTPPTVYYSITSGKYDHSASGIISWILLRIIGSG
ncbi:probable purple acid phosphatase 20 [Tanacetum coccineum]